MDERNQKICELIRAAIAKDNILKKSLARKCDVSTSMFSLLLQGDRTMTDAVKFKLIEELNLQEHVERLGL